MTCFAFVVLYARNRTQVSLPFMPSIHASDQGHGRLIMPRKQEYGLRHLPVAWLRISGIGLLFLLVFWVGPTGAQASTTATDAAPRVKAIDWRKGQTLTAMVVVSVAVVQLDAYDTWVGETRLPSSTRDVGLRTQPNLQLLAQLNLDLITITPMYASLKSRLQRIAPVKSVGIYYDDKPVWKATVQATKALGRAVGQPQAAEQLI